MNRGSTTNVEGVCQYLERLAPVRLAETWDNVGLVVGRKSQQVERIITCLTLTEDVAEEAIQASAQLVITHHPILFRATKRIDDSSVEGRILLALIEKGVAVYSPHTAYDSAADGINQQFAEAIGLQDIQAVRKTPAESTLGAGRFGTLRSPETREAFAEKILGTLNATHLEACWANPTISRIAVACGAAADFLTDAIQLNCDTFITGEARFHSILESRAAGVNLILTGHYFSERRAVEQLAGKIQIEFPELLVFASEKESNPTQLIRRAESAAAS